MKILSSLLAGGILLLVSNLGSFVTADFGDTYDETFDCPAFTTCKQVCVPTIADCPTEMLCDVPGETLCPDGTCSDDPTCLGHEETPCWYACAPVACRKVDNDHDTCLSKYQNLYDAEAACGEAEYVEETFLYTYTEPGFIFFYVWFGTIPLLIIAWCAYNQRFSPVPGSTQELHLDLVEESDESNGKPKPSQATSNRIAWQTGYKRHPIGMVLHLFTILTILTIFALLMWLILQYYVQQEAIAWSWTTMRFEDETQVLLCFILVWMYGIIFMFALKFPYSIHSIHLRRCPLQEAQFVAIAVKRLEKSNTEVTFLHDHMAGLKKFFGSFYKCGHAAMTFVFSDRNVFGCERDDSDGSDKVFKIQPVQTNQDNGTKYFTFEFRRYNLNEASVDDGSSSSKYEPGAFMSSKQTIGQILEMDTSTGLSSIDDVHKRYQIVGPNKVEMQKPNFLRNIKRNYSTPFYTYQTFMVFSWLPLWYYYVSSFSMPFRTVSEKIQTLTNLLAVFFLYSQMAFTWGIVIITGVLVISFLEYRNDRNLYRLTHVEGEVEVLRDGQKVVLSQDQLVPGDVITVQPGTSFVDMVIVDSTRVLVDESALTGEANPVGKSPLDPLLAKQVYNGQKDNKRNTVFAGTSVLECAEDSRAIVLQTASYTARGELIRDIFSYRRQIFKFDTEIPVVVTLLCFYACIGWGLAYYWTGDIFVFGWFYGIYVVAGCLPPLLPTVFTVSVGISDNRLAKKKITCTNSESILVAGKVTRAFFDKTGTITKQGLDFISARGKSSWINADVVESKGFSKEISVSFTTDELKLGMACCHSLVSSDTGNMIGNYVDQVMFTNSRAQFDDSGPNVKITDAKGRNVTVARRFDFDHTRMTQSVIIQDDTDGSLTVFCKGSGEAIRELCTAETLPSNFDSTLKASARKGIYQISMASKKLPTDTDVTKIVRDDVEGDLTFEGVINFKNVMRENAPDVIQDLENGEIVSTMITGDNVLTGICIAKEAGIIKPNKIVLIGDLVGDSVSWTTEVDAPVQLPPVEELKQNRTIQLAISGAAWQQMLKSDPKTATLLQDHVRVFGRCTPHDKMAVIKGYVDAGFITLMSGDGGNDCGALKQAHVGVALSDAEASIVAPFASLEKDIASVVAIVREGRCALGSALASYKFVIMYGQILTINQLIAAYFQLTFSEWGWVFMDGVWTITLAFALPYAKAAKKLAPSRPTASILGLHTMSSAIGVLVINFIFVVIAFVALNNQDWYQCRRWENADVSNLSVIGDNYETQVLWLVTGYQVISSATVYNFGYEFRQAWIFNWILVLLLAGYTAIHFYITLVPGEMSCFFRINCLNEYTFDGVFGALSIQNDFNTTIMPESFRRIIAVIMASNTIATVCWDYFVVNGTRRYVGKKRRAAAKALEERAMAAGKQLDVEDLALDVDSKLAIPEEGSEETEPEAASPSDRERREDDDGRGPTTYGRPSRMHSDGLTRSMVVPSRQDGLDANSEEEMA